MNLVISQLLSGSVANVSGSPDVTLYPVLYIGSCTGGPVGTGATIAAGFGGV